MLNQVFCELTEEQVEILSANLKLKLRPVREITLAQVIAPGADDNNITYMSSQLKLVAGILEQTY